MKPHPAQRRKGVERTESRNRERRMDGGGQRMAEVENKIRMGKVQMEVIPSVASPIVWREINKKGG